MRAAEPLLEVRGLRVSYRTPRGPVSPIDGLSLTLRPREVVGLVGDAGSGKSTAALAFLGLVRPPGAIEAGEVVFEGRDLLALPPEELRAVRGRDIGVIVQNPCGALNPMLRVGAQIGHGRARRLRAVAPRPDLDARFASLFEGPDFREGTRAFLAKRPPES